MGVFVKKCTFPQRRVHYVQYQYFFILHFTYLGSGCVRTQRTPLPTCLHTDSRRMDGRMPNSCVDPTLRGTMRTV